MEFFLKFYITVRLVNCDIHTGQSISLNLRILFKQKLSNESISMQKQNFPSFLTLKNFTYASTEKKSYYTNQIDMSNYMKIWIKKYIGTFVFG